MTIADPQTHAVVMTPPGRGAVAVVQVIGPHAVEAVDAHFIAANGKPLAAQPPNAIRFGHWASPAGEEVVVTRRAPLPQCSILTPRSSILEIHCHGGQAATAAILADLVASGCTTLDWQEWIEFTAPDPIAAEAQIALVEALTERTAGILLDQFHGALTSTIVKVLALLDCGDTDRAANEIEVLLSYADLGSHLTTSWRVVLAGPPNVGKSSLINALLGYGRSIVFDQPGTTRDVVTARTAIHGWPVELADTAGLRDSGDELEVAGVALATSMLAQADLVILVSDATQAETASLPELPRGTRLLRVRNKIDLYSALPLESDVIDTSAKTCEGIGLLLDAIGGTLVPQTPAPGQAVPFAQSQREALVYAQTALQASDATSAHSHLQALLARPAAC